MQIQLMAVDLNVHLMMNAAVPQPVSTAFAETHALVPVELTLYAR